MSDRTLELLAGMTRGGSDLRGSPFGAQIARGSAQTASLQALKTGGRSFCGPFYFGQQ